MNHLKDVPIISMMLVTGLGIWGGVLNLLKRINIRKQQAQKLGIFEKLYYLFMDITTSAAFSIITYFGAMGYGANELVSIALAGIVAYNGTKALLILNLYIAEKLNLPTWKETLKTELNDSISKKE